MTAWVVADSGIYLAIALQEQFAPQAQHLVNTWVQQNYRIAAPYLFRYEIISVIRKHISGGKLALPDGEMILQGLLRQPVKTFANMALLQRAFALANQYQLPTAYDAQYLAVADYLGCDLWTNDKRLSNTLSHQLTWVKWLGNVT